MEPTSSFNKANAAPSRACGHIAECFDLTDDGWVCRECERIDELLAECNGDRLAALERRGDELVVFADVTRQANRWIAEHGTDELVTQLREARKQRKRVAEAEAVRVCPYPLFQGKFGANHDETIAEIDAPGLNDYYPKLQIVRCAACGTIRLEEPVLLAGGLNV